MDCLPFVLLFVGRTGSSYVTEALQTHPEVHMQGEVLVYCNGDSVAQDDFLQQAFAPPIKSVKAAGFKTKLWDVPCIEGFVRTLHDSRAHVIHMRRRNLIKHALSFKASHVLYERTGKWNLYSEADHLEALEVDLNELTEQLAAIEISNRQLCSFVESCGCPTLEIWYEELLENEQNVLSRICSFLGVASMPLKGSCLKNTPDNIEEIVKNYGDLLLEFSGSAYSKYLSR